MISVAVFESDPPDGDDKIFTTECQRVVHLVLDYSDLVKCSWCGRYVQKMDALEWEGKYYCSKDCYDEDYWYGSDGEILE